MSGHYENNLSNLLWKNSKLLLFNLLSLSSQHSLLTPTPTDVGDVEGGREGNVEACAAVNDNNAYATAMGDGSLSLLYAKIAQLKRENSERQRALD